MTSKLKIFVAMPFSGKSYDELVEERNKLAAVVNDHGFELVEQFVGKQRQELYASHKEDPNDVVALDKELIEQSDVLIADLRQQSIGALQEMVIAKEVFGKPVHTILTEEQKSHVWLKFYSDSMNDTLEEALGRLQD